MKTKEIRLLSTEELLQRQKDIKKQLFELHYQRRVGSVEKPARFRNLKKDNARIMTIIKERATDNERNTDRIKTK